ncbi:hypothetical protein QBC36DRAFT_304228 [Triangularia setosa]|uniref:Uncharacterized protein n=1 Tax=Triangularia setosa TaxID=2587417 RepID=A0AAN6W0Q2_9PEZI|nr:hypothetical protein QBC36DRAFT_304228 [Podospora setosa]
MILPALVAKLAVDYKDSLAIHLYKGLAENDQSKLESYGDWAGQGHAILDLESDRTREGRNRLFDWAEHHEMIELQDTSSIFDYNQCLEFDEERGTVFWYEVLHKIRWGYESGRDAAVMEEQYDLWAEWFEKG